jgi:hypothetical protein
MAILHRWALQTNDGIKSSTMGSTGFGKQVSHMVSYVFTIRLVLWNWTQHYIKYGANLSEFYYFYT